MNKKGKALAGIFTVLLVSLIVWAVNSIPEPPGDDGNDPSQRIVNFDGNTIIVYKPVDTVTERNKCALQFLDLMTNIDKYSELKGGELLRKLKKYVKNTGLDFSVVKEYLPFYPDKVYRNIYEGGLMGELV